MTSDQSRAQSRSRYIISLPQQVPVLHPSVWCAPGAVVVGDVEIGEQSSVWYNAVVRGDSDCVRIGKRSNIQDGVVVHTQKGDAAIIGDNVSVGHNAVVHGARVEDGCLIGMNATILSGAVVGEGSLVAAGALVPQGMNVPKGSLVAGIPARIVRQLTQDEIEEVHENAARYLEYAATHEGASDS